MADLDSTLIDGLQGTQRTCAEALTRGELAKVSRLIDQVGVTDNELLALAGAVSLGKASQEAIAHLLTRVEARGVSSSDGSFERVFLLRSAAAALASLPAHPVASGVKTLWCEEIRSWASPADKHAADCRIGSGRFVDRCMFVSLRRFPAGQFDWVRSGLPWSYLLGLRVQDVPMALYVTTARLKGRSPVFFTHNGYRRFGQPLSEEEANRAYYRIARSMELQPDIKGMVGSSWFRSPDVHRASPRLAWLNAVIVENGGFAAVHRKADPNSGALARSPTRQQLYERGEFNPTVGLVIWPRHAMLRWAAAQRDLE